MPLIYEGAPLEPIENIQVTTNVRKVFHPGQLKELANNIAKVGILEPLLVRRNGKGLILIAGERRLRAAKLAKLDAVPIRVLDVDEKQAAEIQAFENLHRQDLTPIEEARAFKMLLDTGGHTVESLAERVDKSVRHVYRAIALLDLPDNIVELIEKGKLTPAHGHQILRVPKDSRAAVLKLATQKDWDTDELPTAKRLMELVDEEIGTDLRQAGFPKDKDYAGEIACKVCPFNSGNQGQLFDGAEQGRCLKKSCFDLKTEQTHKDCAAAAGESFKGIKYLGMAERDYNGIRFKGGLVIDPAIAKDPKAKKLIAEKPEKFGIAVAPKSSYGDDKKPVAVLVCKDPALFREKVPAAHAPKKGGNPYGASRETPRQRFIREKQIEALCRELTPNLKSPAFWVPILESCANHYSTPVPQRVFGLSGAYNVPFKSVKLDDMPALAFLMAIAEHTELDPKKLTDLGVDVRTVKAAARKAAVKEWESKKAAKKARK